MVDEGLTSLCGWTVDEGLTSLGVGQLMRG